MNPVDCKVDNSIDGKISINSETNKVEFVSLSSSSSCSWSYNTKDVLQLMVSKKPPFTSAKIAFKVDTNNSESKILNFTSSAENRTLFVETVEKETKRILKEEEDQQEQAAKVKQEENQSQQQPNSAINVDDDDDQGEEQDLILLKRKAWLSDDEMAAEVFNLLSEVSAFDGSSNNENKNKNKKNIKNMKDNTDAAVGVDEEEDNDDEDDDDYSSLLNQVLQEEERKFFSDPERQEIASASVYDALNDLVDPKTKTLKPITQATAATIFKQIPHLATVFNRVVHSAEDEMLFWVSVVRRRLFFSRTKLDSELSECGPVLCPLGVKKEHLNTNENSSEFAAAQKEEKWELDHQEQRPRQDQVRELQQKQQSNNKTSKSTSSSSTAASRAVKSLVSELNFASGKLVDDLLHQQQQQQQTHQGTISSSQHHKNKKGDDDDFARSLQFGALGAAEKNESLKMMMTQEKQQENRRRGRDHHHDGDVDDEVQEIPTPPNSAQSASSRNINDKNISMQKLCQTLAVSLRQNTTSSTSTTGEWRTLFVGGFLSHDRQQQQEYLSTSSPNTSPRKAPSRSQSTNQDMKSSSLLMINSNKTRNVGSSSRFVHARAAAYLVRVFWRKAKDVFILKASLSSSSLQKKKNSLASTTSSTKKKFDSGVQRLKGIGHSLSKVLEQWKSSSKNNNNDDHEDDENEVGEKKYWRDALEQIEEVIRIL